MMESPYIAVFKVFCMGNDFRHLIRLLMMRKFPISGLLITGFYCTASLTLSSRHDLGWLEPMLFQSNGTIPSLLKPLSALQDHCLTF